MEACSLVILGVLGLIGSKGHWHVAGVWTFGEGAVLFATTLALGIKKMTRKKARKNSKPIEECDDDAEAG